MDRLTVRIATIADARGILEAHYSAVHSTAAGDYPLEVRTAWAMPVTPERIDQYSKHALSNETTVVADVDGRIAGFGAIVGANNELRAMYVAAAFGRRGVGSELLRELETIAKEQGCSELHMDSSLTAAPFYLRHGYEETGRAEHSLSGGAQMTCVKMRKVLNAMIREFKLK
jgi:GNAT superfamily N-acetyltransferase